jgi:aldose 1-epimerase
VVNRIGSNATFTLEGRKYQIDHPDGQQWVLHSGPNGFQKRVWTAVPHDGPEPSLTLTLVSPDGDTGFPGALTAAVTYTVLKNNSLKLEYRATSDAPTVVNLTNHAYFNLAGEGSGDVLNDKVQVFADYFTPADQISIPTGEIRSVAGTPLDFRKPVRVGDTVDSSYDQIATYKGYNINFVLRGKPGKLRPAAKFFDSASGRVMEVFTTQPGMQLFSDNIVGTITGKGGKLYGNRYSMSFETQHYPDSPNHPNFPSEEIRPGHPLHEVTVFRFSNS